MNAFLTMDEADIAFVYFNPHTVEHKKLKPVSEAIVKNAFNNPRIKVYTNSIELQKALLVLGLPQSVFLVMSSGNFDGMDMNNLASKLVGNNSIMQSI